MPRYITSPIATAVGALIAGASVIAATSPSAPSMRLAPVLVHARPGDTPSRSAATPRLRSTARGDGPRRPSGADAQTFTVCPTYIQITQAPPSTVDDATAAVTVEYGEDTSILRCIQSGGPDPSTFHFTVNGVDRTNAFTTDQGLATASAVPLQSGTTNTLIASIGGVDTTGTATTVRDTVQTFVNSFAAVAAVVDGPTQSPTQSSVQVHVDVRNTGTSTVTFTMTCSSDGPVGCGTVSPSSSQIAANGVTRVTVNGVTTSSGGQARLSLTATSPRAVAVDSRNFTVVAPTRLTLDYTAPLRMLRGLCPTVGAGANSAVQCGDLLYAHAFPAYRRMNEARGATLLYNSATASPAPVVVADFTTFANEAAAQLVRVRVTRSTDGAAVDSAFFSGQDFPSLGYNKVHRLTVPVNPVALGAGTGAYPVRVSVERQVSGVWQAPDTTSTRVLLVDRSRSPFGAGWWPAGVERLYPNQAGGGAMLVLGDGSALYYAPGASGAPFVSPPDDFSELRQLSNGSFVRKLANNRVSVAYSASGLVDSVYDNEQPHANVARYVWKSLGPEGVVLDSIVDQTGTGVAFTRDGTGRVNGISIPGVSAITFSQGTAVNQRSLLNGITDPDNFVTSFGYDAATLRMTTSTARGTGQYRYVYDAIGRVDSAVAPAGAPKDFNAWQLVGTATATVGRTAASPARAAEPGQASFTVFWRRGPLLDGSTVQDGVQFTADAFGGVTSKSEPDQVSSELQRDSVGRVVHLSNSAGADVRQEYDAAGYLVRSIVKVVPQTYSRDSMPRYDTTRYEYDTRWRAVSKVVRPTRDSVRYGYDALGHRTSVTDEAGRVTTFRYTPRGLLDRILEPNKDSTSAAGEDTLYATKYEYDTTTFNLIAVGNANGTGRTSYVYKSNGSDVDTVYAPLGATTSYGYDAIKRVTSTTQIGGSGTGTISPVVVGTAYDDVGRTVTQTDPLNRQSRWFYDAAGRLVKRCVRINPDWCETIVYDDDINPTRTYMRSGTIVDRQYDGHGHVTRILTGVGNSFDPPDTTDFTYDLGGNLTTGINRYSRVYRTYDPYGHLLAEEQQIKHWTSDARESVKTYFAYDRSGRRRAMYIGGGTFYPGLGTTQDVCGHPVPLADGETSNCIDRYRFVPTDSVMYEYAKGRLVGVTATPWQGQLGQGNDRWTFRYDGKGRLTQETIPTLASSMAVTSGYDDRDRMTSHVGPQEDVTLLSDELDRVVDVSGSQSTHYDYDGLGRLSGVSGVSHPTPESYGYDAAGNRLTAPDATFEYSSRGQDSVRHVTNSTNGCRVWYTYDQDGNRISQYSTPTENCGPDAKTDFHYTRDGQMDSTATVGASNILEQRRYWYDAFGRRILMRSNDPSGKEDGTWRYFWSDQHVIVQMRAAYDTAIADEPMQWPQIRRTSGALYSDGQWFLYAPGTDNVLASWNINGNQLRYLYLRDYRGDVRLVTDSTGSAQGQTPTYYGAFGAVTAGSAGGPNQPGFNSQPASGGLVYMRNRWYDPNTGRFTQEDPIGFAGGINLYAYAGNDPVTYSDPFGLRDCDKSTGEGCSEEYKKLLGSDKALVEESSIRNGVKLAAAYASLGTSSVLGRLLSSLVEDLAGGTPAASNAAASETAHDILMPNGSPIGTAGSGAKVREVAGNAADANALFDRLSAGGGTPVQGYPGRGVNLPGGGFVGVRTVMSRSPNTAATVDVNVPGIPFTKIKFKP